MKTYIKSLVTIIGMALVAIIFLLGFNSCTDTCTDYSGYIYYEPVYTSLAEVRAGITNSEQREIVNPGKLYYLNNHILINQPNEGIHVINNIDPQNPVYRTFIEIPGNFDLAGTGNVLYVDSYIDLVLLDVSNWENVTETKRIEKFFPNYNSYGYYLDPERGVVTDWIEVERVEEFTSDCEGGPIYYNDWGWTTFRGGIALDAAMEMSVSVSPSGGPGTGGSLARFTISSNHLYTIDDSNLTTVDISSASSPIIGSKINVGWGIETIFPYGSMLFIGANNGMHIYDISTPSQPQWMSTYAHIMSCDPVVVEGNYAYVTLRDGTNCRMGDNVLEVIDITNPANPVMIKSYNMYNPHGLGIDNDVLFICDGVAGLKIFDATDKNAIDQNMITVYPDLRPIDVIPFNGILFAIAEDGFYQYDYSDLENIVLLSVVDITIGS